jgi:Tfp pilus assembly PilM family ATPase
MMWGKKKDVIGLDIGCNSIKLVELKEDKNGYKLQNLAISPLPSEAIVDGALMDTGRYRRFQDKNERCRDLCLWPFCHC